jgi:acyl-CoA reductase-like NAD-dependent aldehyde dehydrogenase
LIVRDQWYLANDSYFTSASAAGWGRPDPERGAADAHRVRTGTIGVNRYVPDPAAPFGGPRAASAVGLGPEGLANYQQTRTVYP